MELNYNFIELKNKKLIESYDELKTQIEEAKKEKTRRHILEQEVNTQQLQKTN